MESTARIALGTRLRQSQVTSVDGMNTLVVDLIGQQSGDILGRLSVKLCCELAVKTVKSDWRVFDPPFVSQMSVRKLLVKLMSSICRL